MAIKGLKKFNFFPKKSKQDFIAFDLNEERFKLAHVHTSKMRREVANLITQETKGLTDDEISALVAKSIAAIGVKNPRVFLAVPLHLVITRSIEIPSRDPDEIKEIVNLQASRHTPYSRAEIIIDTLNLGVVRENYTKVLLVIVPKDVVNRQTAILEKANLQLEKIFFPPEGICQACSKILSNESSDQTTAIVHMDDVFTSFIVIQKNKILFVRGISIGAHHMLEEKDVYADRFVDELQKSLESYITDEMGPAPSTLLLTGVVAEVTSLDDLFNETLNIPIKHQTYFKHFPIASAAKQLASTNNRVSFFNVIAPLLLYDRMKLDLISVERKLKMQLEQRSRDIFKTAILVLIILSSLLLILFNKISYKKSYLERLTARYAPMRQDAKNLEQIFAKTQLVKDYLATRGESIEVLSELYDAIPNEVRLNEIKYDVDSGKFSVKGSALSMGAVFTFVANLEKSEKFKNVKPKQVETRSEKGGSDSAIFDISCAIEKR
jgi:Tfp pilus assembly PilM family ATPase/Tfp pilus assembly protein PilN